MAIQQASFYCPQCRQQKLFTSTGGINHVLHLLITLFMCGLWLPIWILMAMGDKPLFHCSHCGFSDEIKYLNNPHLRQNERIATQRRQASREKTKQETLEWIKSSSAYLWAANPQNTWKVAVGTIASVVIIGGLIFTFGNFSKPTPSAPTLAVVATPTPVDNNPVANKLKKDIADGHSKTTWYSNIKNIAVNNGAVGVFTDLPAANQKAGSICGAVSFAYYGYSRENHNHTILVYGSGNNVLIKRVGIAAKCK